MLKKILLFSGALMMALLASSCSKKDPFAESIYSEQPKIGLYQEYLAGTPDLPEDGLTPILALGSEKGIITKRGFLFKDSDGDGELDPYEDWRKSPRERAADLVGQMTVEQKLGLLSWRGSTGDSAMTRDNMGTDDKSDDEKYFGIDGLEEDGTVIERNDDDKLTTAFSVVDDWSRFANSRMSEDPVEEVKFNNNLQGLSERLEWGIPHLLSAAPDHDAWNGNEPAPAKLSQWPYYLGLGAIDDLAVTKKFGTIMREEIRMQGRHMVLGPQVDIASEPRWGRIQHLFHADGETVASHAEVLIKAMQGGDELKPWGIAAIAKHFPGSGSVEEGMDSHTYAGRNSVFPGDNLEEHLIPFKAAINANAAAVMPCYSIMDIPDYKDQNDGAALEEGAAFSKALMTDLLKTELGFDGAVLSDWSLADKAWWGHEDIKETGAIVAEMLNAGTYQYGGADKTDLWLEAYNEGLISVEKIDEAAIRSLELQFKLGLFENPYVDVKEAEAYWDPAGKEMRKRMDEGLKAMKKAMVLCENPELAQNVSLLPVKGGNTAYISTTDSNGNGKVDVYFDSAYPDADSGQDKTYAVSTDDRYKNINFVSDIEDADIAIVRIYSRGATYFGTLGGTPLSFDAPVRVWDHEAQQYTDEEVPVWGGGFPAADMDKWEFSDWSFVGGGGFLGQAYRTYLGAGESMAAVNKAIAAKAKNPGLKIIVGMTASRPGIVSSFLDDIDGLFIDFAATDKAFLDVVFWQNGSKPGGKLPVEIPSSDASVEAQLEDVPGDTANPTYEIGYGLEYVSMGGYGN